MILNKIKNAALLSVATFCVSGCTVFEETSSANQVEAYKQPKNRRFNKAVYTNSQFHEVKRYDEELFNKVESPKNIILLIGDGMGVSQVMSGLVANKNQLYIENFKDIGFSKTQSANKFITDSGAGGTAIATGVKTNNQAIGVDAKGKPVPTVLEIAEQNGLATGLVATAAITHATPASFIAHVKNRNSYQEIATHFLNTDIDVFIGGGRDHFEKRRDRRNLTEALRQKSYQVCYSVEEAKKVKSGKLACLTVPIHNPRVPERGSMLEDSTKIALDILKKNQKGFFLMVEGSEIDHGGHFNDSKFVIDEMLDFDKTIGVALEFAAQNGETLVIVASDHETGGLAINNGNMKTGKVVGKYTSGGHTGVMVPTFAIGPGSTTFRGIYENTELFHKMVNALNLKK